MSPCTAEPNDADRARRAFRIVALVAAIAGLAVFSQLWAPLVLAAWTADLVRPLARRLERVFRGRRAAAGVVSVLLVLVVGGPLALAAVAVAIRAHAFANTIVDTAARDHDLAGVVQVGGQGTLGALAPDALAAFLRENAAPVWRLAAGVASASATALVGALVFIVGLYGLSAHGPRFQRWLARRTPLDPELRVRLARAFRETGRGLLIGAGGTALAQAVVATTVYALVGVDNALMFGLLTGVASFVPGVGTALVWAPLAVVLATTGHPMRGVTLAGAGFAVIGTIDNVVRPLLVRAGRLDLPVIVVFLSMIGGLRLWGATGLLLGPLLVRLSVEALAVARERGAFRRRSPSV